MSTARKNTLLPGELCEWCGSVGAEKLPPTRALCHKCGVSQKAMKLHPRTDAEAFGVNDCGDTNRYENTKVVLAEFAERLEEEITATELRGRARLEVMAAIAGYHTRGDALVEAIDKMFAAIARDKCPNPTAS